jgi:hypothetical protein
VKRFAIKYVPAVLVLALFVAGSLCPALGTVYIGDLRVVSGSNAITISGSDPTADLDSTTEKIFSDRRSNISSEEIDALRRQNAVDIEELIVLTGEEATTDEMFGPERGNIHAFVSLNGEYTGNVYNIKGNEQSNFLTSISPGVWFITPKAERLPVRISSYNTAVGGSRFAMPSTGSFDRFQAYILGGFDYKLFSIDSEMNYTAWGAEGMFQYNLPAGISFRIMDKLIIDRDRVEVGSFDAASYNPADDRVYVSQRARFRDFLSNQAIGFLNFDMGSKFTAMLSYTNFFLDYDDSRDAWLDRIDNMLALDLNYHFSPKTSLFVEGRYAVADYDTADYNDSESTFFYGGVKWHKSIKSQFMLKAGYQIKSFENRNRIDNDTADDNVMSNNAANAEDVETIALESWWNYRYSDKTKFSFKLSKAIEETDTALSTGKDTISARLYGDYEFTERLRTYLTLRYEHYDYEGYYLAGEERDEEYWGVNPAVQYDFRKWLMAELSYLYEIRDSSIEIYDFTTHTLFLSINVSF